MFRAKATALYFLLTVLAIVTVHYALDEGVESAEQALNSRVSHGFEGFEKLRQLQQLSMHNQAFQLATSELSAYLRTLEDFRNDFLDLEREIYSRWPSTSGGAGESAAIEARRSHVSANAAFIPRFAQLLADRLHTQLGVDAWTARTRDAFIRDTEAALVDCASVAMNKCFFKLTREPLLSVLQRIVPSQDGAFEPDVVLVTDRRGVGWANSNDAMWSDQESFAERYPIVREIQSRGVVDDLVQFGPEESYHFLTGMGMYEGDRYIGAVLIGVEVDEDLVDTLAHTLGMDVTLMVGDKYIASSVDVDLPALLGFAGRVVDALPPDDRYKRAEVREDGGYAGIGFYYHRPERRQAAREKGAFVPRYIEDLKVVMSINQGQMLATFQQVKALLPLFGAFLFAIGLVLFMTMLREYSRPFVTIDQGVQEVLAGNRDWVFRVDSQEELPRSLAENLTHMVAALTGRELLPDDADVEWAERLMVDDALLDGGPPFSTQLAQEPEDMYRRRLYREFLDARRAVLGTAGEPMTFEAFSDILARYEEQIRRKYACQSVRFHVTVREEQVVLAPEVVG